MPTWHSPGIQRTFHQGPSHHWLPLAHLHWLESSSGQKHCHRVCSNLTWRHLQKTNKFLPSQCASCNLIRISMMSIWSAQRVAARARTPQSNQRPLFFHLRCALDIQHRQILCSKLQGFWSSAGYLYTHHITACNNNNDSSAQHVFSTWAQEGIRNRCPSQRPSRWPELFQALTAQAFPRKPGLATWTRLVLNRFKEKPSPSKFRQNVPGCPRSLILSRAGGRFGRPTWPTGDKSGKSRQKGETKSSS